jgi:hypothetical protein
MKEDQLDGNHLVVKCSLQGTTGPIESRALIDCGATGYAFIDEEFVRQHNLPKYSLRVPRALEVIDGRPIASGDITHLVKVPMQIGGHQELLPAFVTRLGHYPLVMGIPWLKRHDVTLGFQDHTVKFASQYCQQHCMMAPVTVVQGTNTPTATEKPISIAAIGSRPFKRLMRNSKERYGKLQIFALSLHDINKALEDKDAEEFKLADIVPKEYHQFLPLFRKANADKLPPHRPHDHKIELKEGFTPPFGPLYSLSRHELEALKEWLEENLSKGFIRASSSSAASPILFVKKGDGSLRLCVDYRGLNEGTIKDRYPLPLIQETLMRLSRAKYFPKLDVRGAYNLVRMREGDEWKTAFRTRYGLFESLVMPFGLTNAPATFQHFINGERSFRASKTRSKFSATTRTWNTSPRPSSSTVARLAGHNSCHSSTSRLCTAREKREENRMPSLEDREIFLRRGIGNFKTPRSS